MYYDGKYHGHAHWEWLNKNKKIYCHIVAYQYEFSVSFSRVKSLRFVIPARCVVHEEYFHDRRSSVVFETLPQLKVICLTSRYCIKDFSRAAYCHVQYIWRRTSKQRIPGLLFKDIRMWNCLWNLAVVLLQVSFLACLDRVNGCTKWWDKNMELQYDHNEQPQNYIVVVEPHANVGIMSHSSSRSCSSVQTDSGW